MQHVTIAARRLHREQRPTPARTGRFVHGAALLTALALLLGSALAQPRAARAGAPLEIEGTWFVLIHYTDSSTANPEATRWLDLAWRFAYKGSRLEWTEYPLVVFEDGSGRFEARGGNPRARVLAGWEPNADQQKEIDDGPRANPRGVKIKTLKGSKAKGWKSSARMTQTSASVVGYQENLSITDPTGLPTFRRADIVGNALTHTDENGSTYRVDTVSDDGDTLSGTYVRDGIRHGRFRMWRTKPVRGLPDRDGTPNDRANERARKAYEAGLD